MDNWEKIKNEILKDSQVKKAYDDMDLEYQLLDDVIRLRNKRKMTQKELAEKIGTTQSALSRFEMGKVSPSLTFLKKMAGALGTRLKVRLANS